MRGEIVSHPEPEWIKRALRIGLILVVIGVVGEWRYGAKLEDAHNSVHEYDVAKLEAADEKAGNAAHSSEIASREANAAKLSAKRASEIASSAEADLKIETDKRAELEKTITPRFIWLIRQGDESIVDELKQLPRMSVRIEVISDWEARRAASNLASIFIASGWSATIDVAEGTPLISEGVTVKPYLAVHGPTIPADQDFRSYALEDKSHSAAKEVIAWLKANEWEAKWGLSRNGELAPNQLVIEIGYKPASFFEPEYLKSVRARVLAAFPEDDQRVKQIKSRIDLLKSRFNETMRHRPQ